MKIKEDIKKIKKILDKPKIWSIIMALFSYCSLFYMEIIPAYNIMSWLLILCLIILFRKTNIKEKCLKKEAIILSLLFAFLTMFGHVTYHFINDNTASIIHEFLKFSNFFCYIGVFNIIYIILINILPKLYNYTLKNNKSLFKNKKFLFTLVFVIILLCWLPFFLTYYPGVLTPDSLSELGIIINDFKQISDHHPLLHVLFILLPYKIGYSIFQDINIAVSCSIFFQMLVMDLIITSFIIFLHNRRVNDKLLLVVLFFYTLLPMHGHYSISMWKDVIFAGCMLLLSMETIKIIEKQKNNSLKLRSLIPFIVISLLCIFLRNNAIYMYLLLIFVTLIMFKKDYKVFIISFTIILSVYAVIKGPVFNYFSVEKSSSKEYIGIPLQQVGRMAFKNIKFTTKEQALLNKLMPLAKMKEAYSPYVSDGIKFSPYYNSTEFDNNKKEYFKLWLLLVIKHPGTAIESYAASTLGYWYPGVNYWSVADYIDNNDYGITMTPKTNLFKNITNKLESKDNPIFNLEWSIGLCFWLILIFSIMAIKKRGIKYLYCYVPIIGIWLTLMIASPVFAEFRYVYCAYTCLPLLFLVPYLNDNSKE